MARLALSKLGLSGNLLKTSIDWPRLDKAGPGWTRLAWAGQGQWKSPFRVVDWPGPAWAGLGPARPALFSDFYLPELARAGPGRPCPVWASPGRPGLARASPARPLFCTGKQNKESICFIWEFRVFRSKWIIALSSPFTLQLVHVGARGFSCAVSNLDHVSNDQPAANI